MRRHNGGIDGGDGHGARRRQGGKTGRAQERPSAWTGFGRGHNTSIASFSRTTLPTEVPRRGLALATSGAVWRGWRGGGYIYAESLGGRLAFAGTLGKEGGGGGGGPGGSHTLAGACYGPCGGGGSGGGVCRTARGCLDVDEHGLGGVDGVLLDGAGGVVVLVSLAFAAEGVDGAGVVSEVVHGRDGEEDTGGEEGYGRPYLGRRGGTRGSSPLEEHAAIRPATRTRAPSALPLCVPSRNAHTTTHTTSRAYTQPSILPQNPACPSSVQWTAAPGACL